MNFSECRFSERVHIRNEGIGMELQTPLPHMKYALAYAENNKPLIRWAGGKGLLLKHILPHTPATFNQYYEPFFGGGALFFALQPENALLSDSNEELMNCYVQIRDHSEDIITLLSPLESTKEAYYAVRESAPQDAVGRAVRFLYLMKLAFNGVHRVNAQGRFNVPYGRTRNAPVCDSNHIRLISALLSSAQLSHGDFEIAVSGAQKGDFVYFDPPYTVAHSNNGFIEYNASIFSWDDQIRLATVARKLAERGCKVLISNADHASIHALYGYFQSESITRASTIAASNKHRRQITECLFHN